MNEQELLDQIDTINIWERSGERAPHKPLLVLLTLSKYQKSGSRLLDFPSIKEELKILLKEFGPYRKNYHPEYPFWYLKTDGFWEVQHPEIIKYRKGKPEPLFSEFNTPEFKAGFNTSFFNEFQNDPSLLVKVAQRILSTHFPGTIHEDICLSLGLNLEAQPTLKTSRDPNFRLQVLKAYRFECAICGYNLRLANTPVGLEAAHIKWYQAGGACEVTNGLALCATHHKLFDRGAFTIDKNFNLKYSEWLNGEFGILGQHSLGDNLKVRVPFNKELVPNQESLAWHREQVFQP